MMKKALSLILALAMALSLAACGGSKTETPADNGGSTADNTSAEPTQMTLILRGGTYAEALKASLPDFEAEHNVKIDVQELSFDDLHTGIALDAVNSTGAYDLCMVDGSWMAEFTENNVLANLSEMGYSFDDDIIPATTTICKVDDNIYLAPFFGNVTVMLYNKQLIADAGYTPEDITTFEDLKVIAQKTKDAGKTGFLIRGGSADNIVSDFIPHLLVHGGWVIDENNQPTVDTPEFKAAMQEYLDLYALGGTMDKDDIVAAIDGGTAALGQAWPGWYVPTADTNANYTVIPTKLNDSDTPKNTSMYGVWCIGIPNNAPHKDLAMELLHNFDEAKAEQVAQMETDVDRFEDELGTYLVKLSSKQLSNKDSETLNTILHCIGDFERISDHARNIKEAAQEMHDKQLVFSEKAQEELKVFERAVHDVLDLTMTSFKNGDLNLARQVEPLEEVIDGLSLDVKQRHVRRLRKGKCTIELGFILSDVITNFERVSDHCSNIAVCLVQVNEDEFDTHAYLDELRQEDNKDFQSKVLACREKYQLPPTKQERLAEKNAKLLAE